MHPLSLHDALPISKRFYSGLQIREGIQEPKPVLISDNKIESVTVRYAKCCHPIYGDNVIAHSDTERGMVLHHKRCQQVKPFLKKDSRYMPAIWGENRMDNLYKAKININVEDKMGILSDLTAVFSKAGINIGDLNTKKIDGKFHYFDIEIEVNSVNELKKIMQKVRAFKYPKSCTRNINEK